MAKVKDYIYSDPKQSGKWSLNKTDIEAQAKAALKWSAPVILLYVTSILGVLQTPFHEFKLVDLIPSTFTVGSILTWFLMQIQGLLLKFTDGR